MSNIITTKKQRQKSIIRDLNKAWNNYIKIIDTLLEEENYNIPNSKKTFIRRRKKGCDDSICNILDDELDKLAKMIDDILKE